MKNNQKNNWFNLFYWDNQGCFLLAAIVFIVLFLD